MLTLIMRCRNRIEYTLQVLNSLGRQRNAPPFNVVLVDNASTDHTADVVAWLMRNKGTRDWLPHIKVVRLDENVGDFGGMAVGAEHVPKDSLLVGQLDNDIAVSPLGIAMMAGIVSSGKAAVAMLKREGFRRTINPIDKWIRYYDIGSVRAECRPIKHAVACYVTRRECFFNQIDGANNCRQLTERIGDVVKVMNIRCRQIEGWQQDGQEYDLQKQKYGLSEITERQR